LRNTTIKLSTRRIILFLEKALYAPGIACWSSGVSRAEPGLSVLAGWRNAARFFFPASSKSTLEFIPRNIFGETHHVTTCQTIAITSKKLTTLLVRRSSAFRNERFPDAQHPMKGLEVAIDGFGVLD
jgi:hypothetical protein